MSEETDAAFRYRQHAEELRTMAGESNDPLTKKIVRVNARGNLNKALHLVSVRGNSPGLSIPQRYIA
jgi:hypothetical protein